MGYPVAYRKQAEPYRDSPGFQGVKPLDFNRYGQPPRPANDNMRLPVPANDNFRMPTAGPIDQPWFASPISNQAFKALQLAARLGSKFRMDPISLFMLGYQIGELVGPSLDDLLSRYWPFPGQHAPVPVPYIPGGGWSVDAGPHAPRPPYDALVGSAAGSLAESSARHAQDWLVNQDYANQAATGGLWGTYVAGGYAAWAKSLIYMPGYMYLGTNFRGECCMTIGRDFTGTHPALNPYPPAQHPWVMPIPDYAVPFVPPYPGEPSPAPAASPETAAAPRDLPKPKPVPGEAPDLVNQFLGRPNFSRAPKTPVRERKIKFGITGMAGWLVNAVTETKDFVEALWKALPKKYRTKGPNSRLLQNKMRDLYNAWDKIDNEGNYVLGEEYFRRALVEVITNEIGDNFYGRVGGLGGKAVSSAAAKGYYQRPVGLQFGDRYRPRPDYQLTKDLKSATDYVHDAAEWGINVVW